MRTFGIAIACLLLVAPAFAARELEQTARTSCSVFGSVSLVVKSGSCKGWAGANCRAHAKAQVEIESAVQALSTQDLCNPIKVRAAAKAVATALASVYVSALSKVSCNGQGFGCGYSVAQGDAFATAYAEAFSKAVAAAYNGDLTAICVADLKAIAVGVARAAAFAVSKTCVNGSGSASSFHANFVAAASKAIAVSITSATAEVCDADKSKSKCGADAFGSSTTQDNFVQRPVAINPPPTGNANGGGFTGGSGFANQLGPCIDIARFECCNGK
ncbi:hypothetical protein BSKO_09354 [Bryopsis sp. KO-2023]|nr:hypothetical protein BSKO_09354 [Bryopsis sp. KO-2023]